MSFSVALINPKYPHNVGQAVRAVSVFGADALYMTGNRVETQGRPGYRLPREERLRGKYVGVTKTQRPFDDTRGLTPVAVELGAGFEDLSHFEHPENALYVFGPEDGGLTSVELAQCHRFVQIPGLHCLNLASAIAVTLAHRETKRVEAGGIPLRPVPEFEEIHAV
jgi:tRNA C32,U32 (ribose-2'-O)-methylase TrmJ